MSKQIALALAMILLGSACAPRATIRREAPLAVTAGESASPVADQSKTEDSGSPTATNEPVAEAYGPEPTQQKGVVVVLGPGLARAYAHAGVLRALDEAKIPIVGIIGVEMGGLIAALYATSASVNEFEWRLVRMKEAGFLKPETGIRSWLPGHQSARALDEFLEKTIGAREFKEARVPVRILMKTAGRASSSIVAADGPLKTAVRSAMGVPGIAPYADWQGVQAQSSGVSRVEAISQASAFGESHLLLVDVVDHGRSPSSSALTPTELKSYCMSLSKSFPSAEGGVSWQLQPDLKDVGYTDSERSAQIIYQGKKAAEAIVPRILTELKSP